MKDYRALAEQYIRDHDQANRFAPFDKFEKLVVRLFAEWLSKQETQPNHQTERKEV